MKKLIAFFIVIIAPLFLSEISSAQAIYEVQDNGNCLPFQNLYNFPSLIKPPAINTVPFTNYDPKILLDMTKKADCDPGILLPAIFDHDIDPGIIAPFNYYKIEGMPQPEFMYPVPQRNFDFPLRPNLLPGLNLMPRNWLNSPEMHIPDFNEPNWDMLTPNEKFELGIHPSYPFH